MTWQFIVFRFNEHETDKAKAMASEIGVDRITFRAPLLDVDRYPLPESEKTTMAGWEPTSDLVQIANSDDRGSKRYSRCGWHYMSSAINWDGSVASCCTTFETRDDFGALGKDGRHSYMDVINNSAFRAVRDRFAGRTKEPVNLVCEKCPTPSIMNYHTFLNRQVILFTAVGLWATVRRFLGRSRSGSTEGGALRAATTVRECTTDRSR